MIAVEPSGSSLLKVRLRNTVLLAGSAMTVMATAIIAPALPAIETAFADQPAAALLTRLTLTIPGLSIAFAGPVAGLLIDRWGRRPVLLLSLLLYGVMGTAGFLAPTLLFLLLSRVLLGVGMAGIMSSLTTLIGDYFAGPDLARFMGWQAAGNSLGSGVAVLIGGFLADVGWRYPFLIYLVAFLLLPLAALAIAEPRPIQQAAPRDGPPGKPYPWRIVLPVYAVVFAGMALFYLIPVQLPYYLAQAGAGGALVGIAIAALTLAGGLGSLNYRRLKARLSFSAIFAFTFLLMSLGYFIIGAAGRYSVVIFGLLVTGSGLAYFIPNSNVRLVSGVSAQVRGRTVGAMTTALHLGQFFSPILAQPVIARAGLGVTFQVAGIGLLLMALPFLFSAVRARARP